MSERIRQYWPPYYDTILEFIKLAEIEQAELQQLDVGIEQLLQDQFVLTSGLSAIRRREQMLGIQADPGTESLDFRRKRIVNRYSTKPPFTLRYLQQQLDQLTGPGRALAELDVQSFILTITAAIEDSNLFREVRHTVETIKPANIIYQQNTALEDVLVIEEHIASQQITWNYKLDGAWQLGQQPFSTLGTEVVIK